MDVSVVSLTKYRAPGESEKYSCTLKKILKDVKGYRSSCTQGEEDVVGKKKFHGKKVRTPETEERYVISMRARTKVKNS